eukprot:TRINITY_DN7360_c0_g2_i16.p1 TRINITY_DN7360_c0_g2~~TRINITY_DN7360_c0_g2_i16.p1  ORF type:complete len:333 (+),score=46.40 TRINITY_DN7360_c0_g2_i16:402-1400(+)
MEAAKDHTASPQQVPSHNSKLSATSRGACRRRLTSTVDEGARYRESKSKGCRKRGAKGDCSKASRKPWSEQEELEMLIAHRKYQNNWSSIVQVMDGRDNNSIKNRFYSIFRKVKNKIRRMDFSYGSNVEIASALYMIQLMEHHLANPLPSSEITGKRGKDFLYSLLKGLFIEDAQKYRRELASNGNCEFTLEELWLESVNHNFSTKSSEALGKGKLMNAIPFMTHPYKSNKFCYILPLPLETANLNPLSPEEKTFIKSQVFREKEQHSIFPDSFQRPGGFAYSHSTLFSAGPNTTHFEGFSEYTAVCSKKDAKGSAGSGRFGAGDVCLSLCK